MEVLAATYGWSPAVILDLDLDDLEVWAELAEGRQKINLQLRCPLGR